MGQITDVDAKEWREWWAMEVERRSLGWWISWALGWLLIAAILVGFWGSVWLAARVLA